MGIRGNDAVTYHDAGAMAVDADDRPIFETDWQSFRVRKGKGDVEPLVLTAEYKYEQPGHYQVAARVTDVFGNDGIATVACEVS